MELVDDGEPAVAAALSGEFDAVFMDCQMPTLNGLDATRRIRAGGSRIPIIAMTAGAFDDDRRACLEAGMDDFLPKPWKKQQLTDVLSRLAAQHRHAGPEVQDREDPVGARPTFSTGS